jgi:hypothetical protein
MNRFDKNTTVDLNIYQTYTSQPNSNKKVDLDLMLDVPVNQIIRYKPSFLEKVTIFWVQYLALLIPSLFINYYIILGSGFERKIIPSSIRSDIKHA